ncbi:cytochrome c biogenesis heme-transporting ATPase CcmA [Aliiglaciecola sp. CAU 1673]|nr:cytochrome c biogenesis heme-transporting ATPase CcmA [Aliiglaciecola sp. CAU 1673]MDF2177485.1 cytochrome c biogenesis heme-transporting ATPase CcmA [Aliiglaciecola sp. CAU 1673]
MSCLIAHNLTCIKRDRVLFDSLSFSVDKAEILHLQGPNGAGKTSLLRILTGLAEPAGGDVTWGGESVVKHPMAFQHQLQYFGHKLGVNLCLNPLENLQYWCQIQGIETNENLYALLDALGLVGLEELACRQLSAGQQRRVALARLWLKPAALWVLDEPFTALDRKGIMLLKQKITSHLQSGGSVVMTSHQQLDMDYPVKDLHLEYRL